MKIPYIDRGPQISKAQKQRKEAADEVYMKLTSNRKRAADLNNSTSE